MTKLNDNEILFGLKQQNFDQTKICTSTVLNFQTTMAGSELSGLKTMDSDV